MAEPGQTKRWVGAILALLLCHGAGCATRSGPQKPPAARSASGQHGDAAAACGERGVAVQILGSGGPIAGEDGRAGSSYLVWIDGRARLMVDLGPGATVAYGRSGARLQDLEALLISHFHADHANDLPAFIKSATFGERSAPLRIAGPSGNQRFPDAQAFLDALFGSAGAFRYLDVLNGRPFALQLTTVDAAADASQAIPGLEDLEVQALSVHHGPVPALAYSVRTRGLKIVFMGDQRADQASFSALLRGADLFVAHMAVGQQPSEVAANLHATPGRLGEVAAQAGVRAMVVSHLMPRSLRDLDANLDAIRSSYAGPLEVAEDGLCVPVAAPGSGRPLAANASR